MRPMLPILTTALPALRTFLEPKWRAYQTNRFPRLDERTPVAEGVCRHTTLFLFRLLRSARQPGWVPVHGYCRIPFMHFEWLAAPRDSSPGLLTDLDRKIVYHDVQRRDGRWDAAFVLDGHLLWAEHWWLDHAPERLDLTIDQFGWPTDFCGSTADPRYRIVHPPNADDRRTLNGVRSTVSGWEADPEYRTLRARLIGAPPTP